MLNRNPAVQFDRHPRSDSDSGEGESRNRKGQTALSGHGVSDGTIRTHRKQHSALQTGSGEHENTPALRQFRPAEDRKVFRNTDKGEFVIFADVHRVVHQKTIELLFVFAQDTGFDQFVNELLHGVESAQKTLGRHDDTDIALGNRGLTIFCGLQSDEVKANHVSGEVDLTDTVCEDFFFGFHFTKHLSFFVFCFEGK